MVRVGGIQFSIFLKAHALFDFGMIFFTVTTSQANPRSWQALSIWPSSPIEIALSMKCGANLGLILMALRMPKSDIWFHGKIIGKIYREMIKEPPMRTAPMAACARISFLSKKKTLPDRYSSIKEWCVLGCF